VSVDTHDTLTIMNSQELKRPPYQKPEQAFNDIPRQWWRNFRRRLGLPASSDVGILAELLEHVVEAVSPLMGDQKAAVISFPDLPALYQEDILDAAGFVGLLALQVEKWEKVQPQKHVAAFAGYGLGLCEDYKNWTKCHEEAAIMPWRHVVLFDYTKSALLLHHRYYKTAWVDRALQFDMASSFDLGSTKDANEGDIRDFVLQFMRRYIWPHEGMVVDFILTGEPENYRDGKALRAIEEAADIVGSTVEAFFSNPDYVAARGATEMAFRSSQGGE
jgi:hypothetical protein